MKFIKNIFVAGLCMSSLISCAQQKEKKETSTMNNEQTNPANLDIATFGAGCFWCVEAQFQMLDGVVKTESGYSGGQVKNPSYKEVCNGTTGHAEVIQVTYDKTKLSYEEMLEAF